MRGAVLLVAAVLALAPPAWAGQAPIVRPIPVPGQSEQQRGAALFAGNCARCHGSRGEGLPPRGKNGGPSLKGAGALAADFYLTTGYMPLDKPTAQPVHQRQPLHRDEIRALTTYVASLGRGAPVPSAGPGTGDVARGLELFTSHCAGCHQVVAEGGVVTGARVPPLDRATPRQIREAVRVGPWVMPRYSTKAISPRELEDIVAYVQYAKQPHDAGGWAINHLGPFPEGMVTWLLAMVVLIGICVAIGSRVKRGATG